MSKIAYVRGTNVVHVSAATLPRLGNIDLHTTTVCGTEIPTSWAETPRPTETYFESDLRRCKRCESKSIEGVPAFDYEEELASLSPHGRCDTCGAPCDSHGCTRDRAHLTAVEA